MKHGKFSENPVIVMGMHRSGTTMLSLLLKEMDGHLGADLSRENLESFSLMRLNNILLSDCRASWYAPGPMWKVLEDERWVERLAAQLRNYLSNNSTFWGKAAVSPTPSRFWGWKDPRNTLTLPIWKRVFPEARIIYIVRNGIDVAQSLVKRDQKARRQWIRNAAKKWLANRFSLLHQESRPVPFTLEDAFQLWAEYLTFAHFNLEGRPNEQILRLRYEDFLGEPLTSLRRVADFVGAGTEDTVLSDLAARIDSRRRFAFSMDAQLRDFYDLHRKHPHMVENAYDRLLDKRSEMG